MRIAVINETSAADKNKDIMAALQGRGHDIINAGMTQSGAKPELTYIHSGFLAGLLLNLRKVDLVIGGCGTGQGFLNSVMQYPNIFCGLIQNPLDAWLFGQINGGNCISLALNYGYGWAGDVNLRFIFDKLFSLEAFGLGYPPHRQESQQNSRRILANVSQQAHKNFSEIVASLDDAVVRPVLEFPGIMELLQTGPVTDAELYRAIRKRQGGRT
jgi:ribose 5-phosphate isomerase RpiB